jgi:aspartate-semialdehyde dehydrogenase
LADLIALVGGDTLLGRELRDVFSTTSLGHNVRLVASEEEESGKLTEIDGGAAFLAKLDPNAIEDAAVIVLATGGKLVREILAGSPEGVIVDVTGITEENPGSRLRAPQVEEEGYDSDDSGPQVIAHPAATALAMALTRLNRVSPITRAIAHVFEPASERGKEGIDELQAQTVSLLSFQQMPKKVFDTQVSFAMLARLGEEAGVRLQEIEERIERHLATLLDRVDGPPMPSLRLIQAPVFHGYTFSLWVEFEEAPTAEELEEAFTAENIDVRGADLEPPTNVSVAGQSGIAVGAIEPDRNNANALWIWMAADNLRIAAESAAMVVGAIL